MHSRPARAEGSLDQHAGSLLSPRPHDFLGAAQVRRFKSAAVSHPQRVDARGIGGIGLAPPSTTRGPWRMARCGTVGVAPRYGAVSRVGD